MAWFLTTARLAFRRWTPADLPLALGLWGDPAVTRLIDARTPLNAEQVQERLERELDNDREHDIQYWPVFLRSSGEHLGCCGLRPFDLPARIFELGFHFRPACWGRGYASEASRAVIAYAFNTLQAAAVVAGHHPENHASRRVLLKLGFTYAVDVFYPPTGLLHPSYRLENAAWRS